MMGKQYSLNVVVQAMHHRNMNKNIDGKIVGLEETIGWIGR
jgi:hypothetical protein